MQNSYLTLSGNMFLSKEHCKAFLDACLGQSDSIKLPEVKLAYPISFETAWAKIFKPFFNAEVLSKITSFLKENGGIYANPESDRILNNCWPNPFYKDHPRNMSGELIYGKNLDLISKETRIISFGSCFAVEIAYWLQKNGYNYLKGSTAKRNPDGLYPRCCNVGNIYNTPSFTQLLNWITGTKKRPFVFYENGEGLVDPFCEEITLDANDVDKYIEQILSTYSEASELIKTTDLIILTFGLNEVYKFLPTMDYMFRYPKGLSENSFKKHILSVEENIIFLNDAIKLLQQLNPSIKILLSISPVPLMRSFQTDRHVAESTMHSKSVLRLAAESLRDLQNVYYFPSYETVMYPGYDNKSFFSEDERHIEPAGVQKIMDTFEKMFCQKPYNSESKHSNKSTSLNREVLLSLEVAHKSIEDLTSHYNIKSHLINSLHDSISVNSIVNNCNSELAYNLFRFVTTQTGMRLNHIQGDYFFEAGSFKTTDSFVQRAGDQIIAKGWAHIRPEDVSLVLDPMREFLSFNQLICERTSQLNHYSDLIGHNRVKILKEGCLRHFYDGTKLPLGNLIDYILSAKVLDISKYVLGHIGYCSLTGWTSVYSNASEQSQSRSALKFHYDCDNMGKWLKVFIFLNDVSLNNGPHVFVQGSHIDLNSSFNGDGRFDDSLVAQTYPNASKTFSAKAGDILIVDTIGLHKGLPVKCGHRDLIQFTLAQTAFGKPKQDLMARSEEIKNKLFLN